jgi:serine protease Do
MKHTFAIIVRNDDSLRRNCLLTVALVTVAFISHMSCVTAHASDLRRSAIVRAVQQARPSIVNIHGKKNVKVDNAYNSHQIKQVNGMGTGVVIDERGYLVTNHHVIDGVQQINVTLANGRTYVARVVSRNKTFDVAVIKIDAAQKLPVIKIGTSSDLIAGEDVVAVGNAYGYEHTVTRGIISALHRDVPISDTQKYENLIQTDASINPGNSGGPLLNIDGEMIGMNVAVRAGAQGIGFAIPINKVLDVTAKLIAVERLENKWHGLVAKNAGAKNDAGMTIEAVEKNSPAAKGGLLPGDIIVGVGDQTIGHAIDYELAMLGRSVNEEIELSVRREGEEMTKSLVLARGNARRSAPADHVWEVLGMKLAPIPQNEFRRYGSSYDGGLTVLAVRRSGPAETQGIRRGDVLVGMQERETLSLDNVRYILKHNNFTANQPVKFYILRGNDTLYGHMKVASRP